MWSAGCATGEEAYSLAMTVSDLLTDPQTDPNVRIYATDLDDEAIAFARRGIYPARSLARIPPGLLERYFTESGEDYEVRKVLRGMIVFGAHDLGQRAPFSRIDLILCRNVLIYFTPALQRHALQLFAFSLRIGGYLVLGKSESIRPLAEHFAEDQPRLKIFRRMGERALIPSSRIREPMPVTMPSAPIARQPVVPQARPPHADATSLALRHAEHTMMAVPFGVILVDHNYDIQYINGEARRLFGIYSTAFGQDLIHLIRHFDPMAVRRVIDAARPTGEAATPILTVSDTASDLQQTLEITCALIAHNDHQQDSLKVVTAIDVTTREQLKRRQMMAAETSLELTRANEEVLAANQQLMFTISTLRAEKEQLLVAAEEIQAATEEVETLNEELQASNEELETLNEELQATVEELNTTNDDLQAQTVELQRLAIEAESARKQLRTILDGIDAAIVVVEGNGAILLENEAHARLFADAGNGPVLVDEQGNPLAKEAYPIQRAATGNAFIMQCGLETPDGIRWLAAKGSPMPTVGGGSLVVVSMRDTDAPARDR
ncbi:MAG: CheR family methyltransferase [Thermomicrobiales bacterium]